MDTEELGVTSTGLPGRSGNAAEAESLGSAPAMSFVGTRAK